MNIWWWLPFLATFRSESDHEYILVAPFCATPVGVQLLIVSTILVKEGQAASVENISSNSKIFFG